MKLKPAKTTLLYIAYFIGITLFFLWYLFPSDTLRDYLAYRLSRENPAVAVTIDRISAALPPGIRLHGVDIAHRNKTVMEVESLKIMPGLASIFSDTPAVKFKGRLYDGTVSGRAEINDASGSGIKIQGNIAGVKVEQVSVLQQFSDSDLAGGLGGYFVYAAVKGNPELTGKFTITPCRLDLATALFNQSSFEFKNVAADLALRNRSLVIKEFNATGSQLDLKINGRIRLNSRNIAKNELKLTGTVTPHHVFLAKIEKDIPVNFLRNKKGGNRSISFKIRGTLEDPGFSLN